MSGIVFLGDVFPKDPIRVTPAAARALGLPHAGGGPEAGSGDARLVLNLEAPLTDRGTPWPGKINLRASPGHLAASFDPPPIAACLANNHVMDFGAEGLADTVAELERLGTLPFGAGDLDGGCRNPVVVEVAGVRVALAGYADESCTPVLAEAGRAGAAPFDLERVRADLRAARAAGADRFVAQVHWGAEHVGVPRPQDVEAARALADLGIDLVIGHHAHRIQSFERYRDTWIFYGLGNAAFPPHASPSRYDAAGRPGRVHRSVSMPWNRISLAVRWDPRTNEAVPVALRYDPASGELRPGGFRPERFRARLEPGSALERRFRFAYRAGKLQRLVGRFLADPKLPGPRHARGVLRMLRPKDAK